MTAFKDTKWLRPRQIAQQGLIVSPSGRGGVCGNYHYILKMIKAGHLRALDYSSVGARPFYVVSEREIERFNAKQHKLVGGRDVVGQSQARKQKV